MSRSKLIGSFFLALLFAAVFIALGLWQLDRAAQLRESQKPYEERPIVKLSKVAEPNQNLAGESVNRLVSFTGSYVSQLDAPNQIDSNGERATWLIGIFEVDGGGEILVVRSGEFAEMPRGEIEVTGRIFHRQFEDQVPVGEEIASGALKRIDPALVVADYGGDFYDGFVVARSESAAGRLIDIPRVDLAPARPTTPGYYWQHIAYVVIWWLMALVVLFMPIYSKRREEAKWRNQ